MEFDESLLIQSSRTMKTSTAAQHRMTLHCQRCNTVLGDSLHICGEVQCLDSIICLRVTNDVVISDVMEAGRKGEMARCIFIPLKCRGCRCAVGKVIHSAPPRLAMLRSMFLLHKANISCYILNHSSMVKASTLSFDLKPLTESMNKVRQQFEAQLDHMSHIRNRLADMSVSSELVP